MTSNTCNTDDSNVLSVDEAVARMLNSVEAVKGFEQVALLDAYERVLDETLTVPFDIPAVDNSAMDGFALRAADLADGLRELFIVGLARTGHPFTGHVESGQTVRITTGAPIPAGADSVIVQEKVEVLGGTHIRPGVPVQVGDNIRRAGEDLKRGADFLGHGRFLTAPDIGLIASSGIAELRVKRRPRVALLATGDELTPLGRPLTHGGMFDSNRYALHAALRGLQVKVMDQGIVRDDPERLREALSRAGGMADVVISTGGVSVGPADFVKDVIAGIGKIDFWRIAMKPGRPLAFGHINGAVFIGLPGNPVSALVGFYLFALPAIEKKMGLTQPRPRPRFRVISAETLHKQPGRAEFLRGIVEPHADGGWQVRTTGPQGSGMLSSMSRANVLICLPAEQGPVQPGDTVEVLPFTGLM